MSDNWWQDDAATLSDLANEGATTKSATVTEKHTNPIVETGKLLSSILRSNSTIDVTRVQHKTGNAYWTGNPVLK